MTPLQHDRIAALMTSLADIQNRMTRMKSVFPTHYAQLQQRYNQLLVEAREQKILPPWMVG